MSLYSFIAGMGTAVAVYWLYSWSKQRGQSLNWWKWLVVCAWVLLLFLTDIFIFTSLGENESRAALMGGVFLTAITVISGVGIWRWFFTVPKAKIADNAPKM
ncbi:dehalogenase [Dehalobacter restrictus]|uniref:Dehalogenase n=1 Tax=Dehalobacter restrictus TaxID=55583 RepID=A0A857DI76_9FIRM|nr:dehalogenase [Dehalobacter restrictus]QHA00994.1 dehalogenase [Dehalobacter restrictus]